jgi:hypothetical protein
MRASWLLTLGLAATLPCPALAEEPAPFTADARLVRWQGFAWLGVTNRTGVSRAICVTEVSSVFGGAESTRTKAALPPSQFGGDRCTSFDNWHLAGPGETVWFMAAHAKPAAYPAELTSEIRFRAGSEGMFLGDAKQFVLQVSLQIPAPK